MIVQGTKLHLHIEKWCIGRRLKNKEAIAFIVDKLQQSELYVININPEGSLFHECIPLINARSMQAL